MKYEYINLDVSISIHRFHSPKTMATLMSLDEELGKAQDTWPPLINGKPSGLLDATISIRRRIQGIIAGQEANRRTAKRKEGPAREDEGYYPVSVIVFKDPTASLNIASYSSASA